MCQGIISLGTGLSASSSEKLSEEMLWWSYSLLNEEVLESFGLKRPSTSVVKYFKAAFGEANVAASFKFNTARHDPHIRNNKKL